MGVDESKLETKTGTSGGGIQGDANQMLRMLRFGRLTKLLKLTRLLRVVKLFKENSKVFKYAK